MLFPPTFFLSSPACQVDYIDIPKRTMLTVPGYEELVEFGVITSFAYPLEDGSGAWGGGGGPAERGGPR